MRRSGRVVAVTVMSAGWDGGQAGGGGSGAGGGLCAGGLLGGEGLVVFEEALAEAAD